MQNQEISSQGEKVIEDTKKSLPICQFKKDLIQAVRSNQILIIEGETGSGKTTQTPQYLKEAGFCGADDNKIIGCTQPRRKEAINAAARVAEEMGVKVGDEVGFAIRHEDRTSHRTLIKYMTDGVLLREFLGEPDFESYSVIIIDEAHERSLHTDILLGLVKNIARIRQDLKIIICSATPYVKKFSDFFDGAPTFSIPSMLSASSFKNEETQKPEIQSTDLGNVILILKSIGVNDVLNFNFMDPPPRETLVSALKQLEAVGALNPSGKLTQSGRQMAEAEFPIDPKMAKHGEDGK